MGSGGSKKSSAKASEQVAEKTPVQVEATSSEKPGEAAAEMPAEVKGDGPYQIVDPPEDFVVEGLKVCGGAVEEHEDVRGGKVLQVAKHPEEHMMQYWLKVEYGPSEIAFVHMLMSCGWSSNHVLRNVGDASFPPDPPSLPQPEADAPEAPAADVEVLTGEELYTIADPPESFVVQGLQSCAGMLSEREDLQNGKVAKVAKHPSEGVMRYWLQVEYGDRTAFVHMLMSSGWTSNLLIEDVGDADFPPDPRNLPSSKPVVPLPDLKPADYEQEFVDPSHLEAIATNEDLKSVFPEASSGQVRSIWRGPSGFWLEVSAECEDEPARYGAHFIEIEEGSQQYTLTCAVKLAPEEEFPPEPRATKGKAVALGKQRLPEGW